MIRNQMFVAVFFACMIGFYFHRAWRWEHGAKANTLDSEQYGKRTFIFVVPTILPWFLLISFFFLIFQFGLSEGIVQFAALMADVLLILSGYYVLLIILLPFLRKWYSARACAVLWLIPACLSYFWYALFYGIPLPHLTVYIPRTVLPAIGTVWLAGFLTVGGYYLISHIKFSRHILDTASEESEPEILAIWTRELEALDYKLPVRLLHADTSSPFSMGQTKRTRCTVLPRHSYSPDELSMIFRHELHHLQRCDVDTKVFLCFCNALCWFNPLVWIATKKAAEDLELSCDEIVTEGMDETERKIYGRLLLKTAVSAGGFTTCLYAAADTLRYRLKGVMDRKMRMPGTWLLTVSAFVCAMCYGTISVCDMRGSFTSLILTPDVKITKVIDPQNNAVMQYDSKALSEELDKIRLERISGYRTDEFKRECITFLLSDNKYAFLSDKAVFVQYYDQGQVYREAYLVTDSIDWDAVCACFK